MSQAKGSALFVALGGLAVALAAFRPRRLKDSLLKSLPTDLTSNAEVREEDIATVLRAAVKRGLLLSDHPWAMFFDVDALHRHLRSLRAAFPPLILFTASRSRPMF